MKEKIRYAIRCTTEEQARECGEQGFVALLNEYSNMYDTEDYNKITYEEALEKGLLGEKKVCKSCLGKKQFTIYKGDQVLQPYFIGDGRYLLEGEGITMVNCSRCDGTGLEPEYIPEVELLGEEESYNIGICGKEPVKESIHSPCPYGNDDCPKCNPVKKSPREDNLVENPIEKAVYDVSKKMSSELDRWILQLIKDRFRIETYYNGHTVRYELYTQYGKKQLGELEINLSSK